MTILAKVLPSLLWFLAAWITIGCTSEEGNVDRGAGGVGGATGSSENAGGNGVTGGASSGGIAALGGSAGAHTAGATGAHLTGAHRGGNAGTHTGGANGGATSDNGTAALGVLRDYLGHADYPDNFWQSASFEALGIDAVLYERALDRIQSAGWEIHSFLVAYKGKLLFERYGTNAGKPPFDLGTGPHQTLPSERHAVFSTTKSVTSTLVGIALDERLISDVNVTAASYFPDYASLSPSAAKSSIMLEDLLTMRSGLEFTEGEQEVFAQPDPARALFSRPVVWDVGQDWNYSSGNSQIVMEILRAATGQNPLDFARTRLFEPLGMVDVDWSTAPNGVPLGGFGLSLTSREMARFGELYRNDGVWAGKRVVSKEWIDVATAAHCDSDWGRPYGYFWFVPRLLDFFNTVGHRGQEIFVSRQHELVVVFTGNLPDDSADATYTALIRDFVVPALPQ